MLEILTNMIFLLLFGMLWVIPNSFMVTASSTLATDITGKETTVYFFSICSTVYLEFCIMACFVDEGSRCWNKGYYDCISGQECNIAVQWTEDVSTCQVLCQNNWRCHFFTFEPEHVCYLHNDLAVSFAEVLPEGELRLHGPRKCFPCKWTCYCINVNVSALSRFESLDTSTCIGFWHDCKSLNIFLFRSLPNGARLLPSTSLFFAKAQ